MNIILTKYKIEIQFKCLFYPIKINTVECPSMHTMNKQNMKHKIIINIMIGSFYECKHHCI